ncbi:hypothetical protein ABT294_32715 [Nonomuraea sp. NPDC000554]|uniref:hypothetical protein n=1 Tax=Nonomuraea sp. NPDC000554 TaxID=3154259 RepID=UPI0033280CDA
MTTANRPAPRPRRSRIGDLRMRDVYRGLAVLAALAVAAVAVVLALPSRPDEAAAGPIAAPSALPSSSAPPTTAPSTGPTTAPTTGPTTGPTAVEPSPSDPAPRATPTPGTSLAPGYTAMEALYADARVPRLSGKVRRLHLRATGKRFYKDERTGLLVPKLGKPWKVSGAAPFTTKQVLRKERGKVLRGTFVTCPLPIEKQKSPRDTALLAARWTLNHHPEGSRIHWLASQPVKDGWMLLYQVDYGKHASRAAVVVLDGGMSKPGLAFVSVPDTQRNRWRDITRVISGMRVLG